MLPGKGCAGIGAMTIGVAIPVRSQLRHAYVDGPLPARTFLMISDRIACVHMSGLT